ncbi:unnamed protein product [Durusdinium trenchii]|uniref:Uncharacterized protein n=2 Tax=Durusdinium trenchii TaxID=1381693 RepID=A0ABP0Q9U8_9DINO
MRGDLDWFKQCWQFEKRGWMAIDCCFFCDAKSKGQTNPYSECGVEAQWNETEFTEAWDWAAHVLPDRLCPLLATPGFSVDTIRLCSMHTFCLGLLQTANGSSLINLIEHGYYGNPDGPLDKNLICLYQDFKAWCKLHKIYTSQRQFYPGLVIKSNNNVTMTHKAYNGRVLCAYTAEASRLALEGRDPEGLNRLFGQWRKANRHAGQPDPKMPLQAATMSAAERWCGLIERAGRYLHLALFSGMFVGVLVMRFSTLPLISLGK